jgi:hypothetical protein
LGFELLLGVVGQEGSGGFGAGATGGQRWVGGREHVLTAEEQTHRRRVSSSRAGAPTQRGKTGSPHGLLWF